MWNCIIVKQMGYGIWNEKDLNPDAKSFQFLACDQFPYM